MKLQPETHRAINGFLDEFLYKILHSSRSLTTDRLRAGLLFVLPTSVGKEAITEAEVELRAFLASRGKPPPEDDKDTFHLQWSFELLRQKCRGYCTMSDGDEDMEIQARINEKMASTGSPPPKEMLLEPAGLYLAAILESTCHHILANVGRVASRDSSRMDATAADLFVALCEDNGIYALFKSMNVYEQIENLSKGPKPRRSKSFTRGDKTSRTSSSHQDSSSTKDSPTPPPGRLSSETSMTSTAMSSRTSIDKTKGMKKLLNSRTSNDYGDGHKRSESILSEDTLTANGSYEDPSAQEFDDLMRSGSTLKVSLTPDRLKTMEVYKQEKDRNSRRPAPLQVSKQDSDSSSRPSPATGKRRPSLRNESIVEDDEGSTKLHSSSSRKGSVSSSSPFPPSSGNRARSFSSNSQTAPQVRKSSSKTNLASPPTSYTSPTPAKDFRGATRSLDSEHFPPKTRKKQHNRESMDLDDVMAGSDDDAEAEPTPRSTVTSPQSKRSVKVSQSTRELMNFLDEGPPDSTPHLSRTGRELVEFLQDGPPDSYNGSSLSNDKKGSGRLQRMMSKLSLGGSEKGKQGSEDFGRGSSQRRGPTTPVKPALSGKNSATNLSALANRPIPPRPPPISPPSSPSEEQAGFTSGIKAASSWEHINTTPREAKENGHANGQGAANGDSQPSRSKIVQSGDSSHARPLPDPKRQAKPSASRNGSVPPVDPPLSSHLTASDAQELRRLMARGTTAEECRLVLEMFLAKIGSASESNDYEVPYPSPSPSDQPEKSSQSVETALENLVVELVLGGDISIEPPVRRRKNPARKLATLPTTNGTAPSRSQEVAISA